LGSVGGASPLPGAFLWGAPFCFFAVMVKNFSKLAFLFC
jgi:hypothetical protein